MNDFQFPKSLRILKQPDFDRVYQRKNFAADEMLVVQGTGNDLDHSRLGLSVSRKVGNAVVRNRWKRLIREAFRLSQHKLPAGLDLVVRPRKGAISDAVQIQKSLVELAARLKTKIKRQQQGNQ